MAARQTDVVIIGAGPSGLMLSQRLNRAGVSTIVLERQSREHVLSRIRAGILEWGTVALLRDIGVSERMDREGIAHDGCLLTDGETQIHIDFAALTGKRVMVYGQTEVTADLYQAQDKMGTEILHGVADVEILDPLTDSPRVAYTLDGTRQEIACAWVAGCDGFHGVSRQTIPAAKRREFERVYPFGWLGLLSETAPCHEELIYSSSPRGFALASMRNPKLSRYYVQVPLSDRPEDWTDTAFWDELKSRLPEPVATGMETGPSLETSIAPLRSFVSEPLRWGRLCLAGDAAHIVPPTGAKGLNLAASDVYYLSEALISALKADDETLIDSYSERALQRIWQAMRFSWSMTQMLHSFEGEDSFAPAMRRTALQHLAVSETARRELAENYVGLPY